MSCRTNSLDDGLAQGCTQARFDALDFVRFLGQLLDVLDHECDCFIAHTGGMCALLEEIVALRGIARTPRHSLVSTAQVEDHEAALRTILPPEDHRLLHIEPPSGCRGTVHWRQRVHVPVVALASRPLARAPADLAELDKACRQTSESLLHQGVQAAG